MNPRAVQMAKAVVDSGLVDVELLGNVIAPFCRGWTNNSVNYYTRVSLQWEPGNPFGGQPCVYTYMADGTPIYRWFPVKVSNFSSYLGSNCRALVSTETGLHEPPIDHL